jgi:hypothetical protein
MLRFDVLGTKPGDHLVGHFSATFTDSNTAEATFDTVLVTP